MSGVLAYQQPFGQGRLQAQFGQGRLQAQFGQGRLADPGDDGYMSFELSWHSPTTTQLGEAYRCSRCRASGWVMATARCDQRRSLVPTWGVVAHGQSLWESGRVSGASIDETTSEMRAGRSPLPPADYIGETRRLYDSLGYDSYRWAERPETPPWVALDKPLAQCRITVVGSGGIYRQGQIAFHTKDDTSIRVIATDTPTTELRTAHFAYDQTDARNDPNCVFPLDRLRELAAEGIIGGLTEEAYAFMGGIYSTRRLETETVPLLVERCRAQEPDLVLLIPV